MRSLVLIIALSSPLLGACATTGLGGGIHVPHLPLEDVDGRTHYLTDYVGRKVVVMTFWATWCLPCKQELPVLQQIYRDDGGTVVPFFRNYVYARQKNVMHGEKPTRNWPLDGARAMERWWFA